jgi:Ser/Thr protein kinase RdoA (MazF antagonist)
VATIRFELAALAGVAHGVANGHPRDIEPGQRLLDGIELGRLNDGENHFHGNCAQVSLRPIKFTFVTILLETVEDDSRKRRAVEFEFVVSIREIQAIVSNYPDVIQPGQIEPLGSAGGMSGAEFWRFESPSGRMVLRRWPSEHPSPERLRWIHEVLFHAAKRGITFIPAPVRTTSGDSFVQDAGHLWELAPWMPGAADFEASPTAEKLRAAMSALARLHVTVDDFPLGLSQHVVGAPAIGRRLARLRNLLGGKIGELSNSLENIQWPEFERLARVFLTALPVYLPRAVERLTPLVNVPLAIQPCLRDIWHDHVLFTGSEVTGIIDFGAVDIDTPATDIARLLGSLVGDDAFGWRAGLDAYATVRPLAAEEETAVRALDSCGTILAGCNWIRWIYVERRQFGDRERLRERFERIISRLTFSAVD